MSHLKSVTPQEFLGLLKDEETTFQSEGPFVVTGGYLSIDVGELGISKLALGRTHFTDRVTIRSPKHLSVTLFIQECHFPGGLLVEYANGSHISIMNCEARSMRFWSSKYERVWLKNIKVIGDLDISGFDLSTGLHLDNVSCAALELIHNAAHGTIKTPLVEVDDVVMATQFRLAGIPVYMGTEAVRSAIGKGLLTAAA